jgi:hypothetical protein
MYIYRSSKGLLEKFVGNDADGFIDSALLGANFV